MAPVEQVAMRLKRLREQRGWSQATLAERAGVSRPYLARLETARQDPRLSTLEKLAKALGVPVARLLQPENYMDEIRAELAKDPALRRAVAREVAKLKNEEQRAARRRL
jgi:transcriptional regulator with XRE-family HTH domain